MITVAFVDDDQMLLDGLSAWLSAVGDITLSVAAKTVPELLVAEAERGVVADVVVLDLLLADRSDPAENVRRLTESGRRVLVLSVVPHVAHGVDVVQAGALGYLTKDHELGVLADAVRQVHRGQMTYSAELAYSWARDSRPGSPRLSTQERSILIAYASGMTLTAAARKVGIQPATAKKYLAKVKEKYGLAGRATYTKLDLANRVREDGLVRFPVSHRNRTRPTENRDPATS